MMRRVLAHRENLDVPSGEDEMRAALVQLAEYAQDPESKSKSGNTTGSAPVPKTKSPAEINSAADKLKRASVSQITKQMKVCRGSTLIPIHLANLNSAVEGQLQDWYRKMVLRWHM
jgi:hypothetical protein